MKSYISKNFLGFFLIFLTIFHFLGFFGLKVAKKYPVITNIAYPMLFNLTILDMRSKRFDKISRGLSFRTDVLTDGKYSASAEVKNSWKCTLFKSCSKRSKCPLIDHSLLL